MKPSYMTEAEYAAWLNGNIIKIDDYTIEPKKDFGSYGYRIVTNGRGENVKVGWIVTKGGALATPGAVWATTVDEAKRMVYALIASKEDAKIFHAL